MDNVYAMEKYIWNKSYLIDKNEDRIFGSKNKKMTNKNSLLQIPWVWKTVAQDLMNLGITKVEDLRGRDPEELYQLHNKYRESVQDRCMLYTFRCGLLR